jgi:hypothetical protein
VLQTRLEARDPGGTLRISLDPTEPQGPECLGEVDILQDIGTGPFIELNGVEILDNGAFPDHVIYRKKDGILFRGSV